MPPHETTRRKSRGRRNRSSLLRRLFAAAAALVVLHADRGECFPADPLPKAPVTIDRGLQQPFSEARSLIARGEYRAAIRSLQPILNDRQRSLVLVSGRYVDAKTEANRLVGSLPPDARALYEREFGSFARRELKHAQSTGQIDDYLFAATTYRHTEAGREALAAAAGLLFDSGRFLEAAAAAQDLIEISGSATQESAAAARLVTARLELGQMDRAQQWMASRQEFLSRHEIEVRGEKFRLDRWLEDRIRQRTAGVSVSDPVSVGGHPQAVTRGKIRRPSSMAVWAKPLRESGVLETLADESIARRVKTGIAPVFHGVPLVVGQTLVVRQTENLSAFNLRTGARLWFREISPARNDAQRNAYLLQNESLAPLFVETLVDRLFTGGAQTAISADKEHVFTVIEETVARPAPTFRGRRRRWAVEAPPKSSLAALDLRDGTMLWRLSEIRAAGPSGTTGETSRVADFLGPPLALGGTLYVLGRTDEGTNLLALDPASGTVRWRHSLSGFAGFEADLVSSRGPACVPVERDGLLICPTPEGILIAVDPVTRTCHWAYRAPPTEELPGIPPRWGRVFPAVEAGWLHTWRESTVRIEDDRCFYISPRSNAIHALSVHTGELLWTRTVLSGLFLGPIVGRRLLVVANNQVFAFDAASGTPLWNVPTGLPSGRGFAVEQLYLLPQASGGLAIVDVQAGSVRFPVARQALPPGNLVPVVDSVAGSATVSQSHDQLAFFLSLEKTRTETAEALRRNPQDHDAVQRFAQLSRETGDVEPVEQHLRSLLESLAKKAASAEKTARAPAKETNSAREKEADKEERRSEQRATVRRELFETLVADIDEHPERCAQLESELLRITEGNKERAVALRTIALALLTGGQRMLALEPLLQLTGADLPEQLEFERGCAQTVAFDRQIRADLDDLLRMCPPEERRQADLRIEQWIESSLEQKDATVLRRISQRLAGVGLKRPLRERLEAALRPDPGFLQAQLDLYEATTSTDALRAAEAWRRLAQLHRSHGDRQAAADCYRRLNADFRNVRFDDGLRPADLLAQAKNDRQLAKELERGSSDAWPESAPEVVPDTEASSAVHFSELPLEIFPGSLGEHLDIAIDHEGKTVRFQSETQSSYWDLPLPGERSRLHGDSVIHRGWSIGPLLIVQVGTELFGVTPLDEGGDSVPKMLWHVDLLGPESTTGPPLHMQFAPRMIGLAGEYVSLLDHLGRPIARVGPVRPGYICYFDRGVLSALDPLSGRLLWKRAGVSGADLCAGDDSLIVLADRRSERVDFLRVLDGKTVAQRPAAVSGIRWLEGREVVTQAAVAGRIQASRVDPLHHAIKWTRSFPGTTHFLRLDARRYAVAEPDGTFCVLDADTGDVITSERVAGAEHCSRIHVTEDQRRFYLAFSTPFADPDNYRANAHRDDLRNPLVNGVLCALDRASGRTLWSRRFEDGVFAVDQSRLAPFLVFMYGHVSSGDDGVGIPWPMLHCINKRTGSDVYFERVASMRSQTKEAFVETAFGRHEVVLRLPDSGLRFRYSR